MLSASFLNLFFWLTVIISWSSWLWIWWTLKNMAFLCKKLTVTMAMFVIHQTTTIIHTITPTLWIHTSYWVASPSYNQCNSIINVHLHFPDSCLEHDKLPHFQLLHACSSTLYVYSLSSDIYQIWHFYLIYSYLGTNTPKTINWKNLMKQIRPTKPCVVYEFHYKVWLFVCFCHLCSNLRGHSPFDSIACQKTT